MEKIPVTISDLAPKEVLEVALVENVQRQDLNPMELGLAFRSLIDSGASQQEVGLRIGLDRSTIANHLRILELPRSFQEDIEQGLLTMGHAKALLQVTSPERRLALRDRILREGLSVRATEELARDLGSASTPNRRQPATSIDPNLEDLVSSLRDRLQTKVKVSGKPARGKIEIEFYGESELSRIAEAILERP
ncbi:ParB/RepB/Spo0J family partition protein [Myxococcota bacterium]|nr:ParB/RepB/Spo0J family partition protein [Myxococcota bacterium]